MQEDAQLVGQTLSGDHQAFHILITQYYTAICNMILSWVKDPEDAKDLTQEVFISAYQELPSLRHPERFYSWLRQIAKRRCQNWQRAKQTDFIPLHDDLISEEPPIDELLILRETLAKVMQAIDELPETEKQLLKSHYIDDVSYADLQAEHGVSSKALVMRLLRAREKVKEKVGKMLPATIAFSELDAAKKAFMGGVEAMKINAKVKVVTIGVAAVLMLSVAGIFLFLDETKSGHEDLNAANPNNPISSENTDQNKEGLYASQKDIAEAIAFLDKLDKNNEYGKNSKADESLSGITVDTIKTDKSTVKDEKTNISERTPEQQHKYDLLAQFLPKYHELHNWFIEIDKEEKVQPPKELLGDEVKIWMQQRSKELESKYPRELRKERYAEQIRIHGLLLREFPEAIEGETFNAPGWGTFTLIRFTNYRKLREIVGGPLPTDKGKYVKVGNDWVPAD